MCGCRMSSHRVEKSRLGNKVSRYRERRGWLGSWLHHVVSLAHLPLTLVSCLPPVFTPCQHKGKRKYGTNMGKHARLGWKMNKCKSSVYNNSCHLTYFQSPAPPESSPQRIPSYCLASRLSNASRLRVKLLL